MRGIFRLLVSAVAGLLLLLAGGLVVYTAETVADEIGYTAIIRRFIREGWSAMVDAGYVDYILVAAVFFSGGAVALWVDYLIRPENPFKGTINKITKTVTGKTFRNEVVILDGVRYEDCHFYNVKFVFNGGKTELTGNTISGFTLSTDIKEIKQYLMFAGEMGGLAFPAVGDKGPIIFTGVAGAYKPKSASQSSGSQSDTGEKTQP